MSLRAIRNSAATHQGSHKSFFQHREPDPHAFHIVTYATASKTTPKQSQRTTRAIAKTALLQ